MRWLDNPTNVFLTLCWSFAALVIVAIVAACTMPHEIFGWKRPENLSVICHVYLPEVCTNTGNEPGCSRTMMLNNSLAKRHINKHKADYWGECQ